MPNRPSFDSVRLERSIQRFIGWLDRYGESSYDFQTFYASPIGRRAKAWYYRHRVIGPLAVAPIIFCEAFIPSARQLFWKPQRFPIADAHYVMAFALRYRTHRREADYRRAVHFLEALLESRCVGNSGFGWGYPFNWEWMRGTILEGTPLITTLPYVYEAFAAVYEIDGDSRWRQVMHSIARHALLDYGNIQTRNGAASATYTPDRTEAGMVVNASAYRAFLLTKAASDLEDETFRKAAQPNLQFVLDSQNSDGSWHYAMDGQRGFIDHFHTCFVLKALAKIRQLDPHVNCTEAITRGIEYYVSALFDKDGLPMPFSRAPRLVVYRRELYDYAECLNLSTLVGDEFPRLAAAADSAVEDLLQRWQKTDGSFRSRQLWLGWDNVPMHRWAQAQLFRSLCALQAVAISRSTGGSQPDPEMVTDGVTLGA